MLAFLRAWHGEPENCDRMARSLGLHAPGSLIWRAIDGACFARVPGAGGHPRLSDRRPAALSIPAILPSGDRVLFTGWFDNCADIARVLDVPADDPASVYGHAVERWGDEAERRVIGAYAAVIDRPRRGEVRLARSPITAPPLHYHRGPGRIAAACVPRALAALGIPLELDEARLAAHLNTTPYDGPGGWYKAIEALQLGVVVTATCDGERRARPYDLTAVPAQRPPSDQACQEQVEALLGEAITRTITGCSAPGMLLSGGLDSTIVASHLADRLPQGQSLPCFTHVPDPAWQGEVYDTQFPDERPHVEAFAAMDARIEPHFCDNAGRGFEDGLDDLFMLAGICPTPVGLLFPYHGLFRAAQERGCDILIGAGMGNSTFSNAGMRGYVEYLRQGRLRQAWRAVAARPHDPRPVWRRFLSLSLLRALPLPLWRTAMRLRGSPTRAFNPLAGALNPGWPGAAALDAAAQRADAGFAHGFYRSREEEVAATAIQMDADACDMMQAFQQRYGIAFRDVTRYRPLVEYCLGLPVDQFLRDGEDRRLARHMGRGRIPEAVRTERRYGFHQPDWHLRIGRRREPLLAELRRMAQDPDITRLVDTERLIAALERFPDTSSVQPAVWHTYVLAVPIGIAAGRYIRFVKGSNA